MLFLLENSLPNWLRKIPRCSVFSCRLWEDGEWGRRGRRGEWEQYKKHQGKFPNKSRMEKHIALECCRKSWSVSHLSKETSSRQTTQNHKSFCNSRQYVCWLRALSIPGNVVIDKSGLFMPSLPLEARSPKIGFIIIEWKLSIEMFYVPVPKMEYRCS